MVNKVRREKKGNNPNLLAATRKIAVELGKYRVRVGWSVDMGADPETVKIAAINTLGAPAANIPARDALTPMMASERNRINAYLGNAVKAQMRGKDPKPILETLAEYLTDAAKQAVADFSDPPNAESTIARKGFNNPLIGPDDGGRLLREVRAMVAER